MNLAALQASNSGARIINEDAPWLIMNSVALGFLLTVLTVLVARATPRSAVAHDPDAPSTPAAILLNSSNIAFLCLGVTSVMLLVASDLARAFAVAAAIALVRFRIKMTEGSGSGLFFSVIIGMACGVDQLAIAWQLFGLFFLMQAVLVLVVNRLAVTAPEKKSALPESRESALS